MKTHETVTSNDKTAIDNLMLSLFFTWQNEITAQGAKRDMEPLKPFMELTGAEANSLLCIMYEAFIAGVCAGLELTQNIERISAERAEKDG